MKIRFIVCHLINFKLFLLRFASKHQKIQKIQNVLHSLDILAVEFRNTPHWWRSTRKSNDLRFLTMIQDWRRTIAVIADTPNLARIRAERLRNAAERLAAVQKLQRT